MKYYDFNKAKQLIEENVDYLESASMGMHQDWFWTANTVWENGEYCQELNENSEVGGINGSSWATPTLQLVFKDGSDIMKEVSKGENTNAGPSLPLTGCLSQPVQDNITPLS